MKIFSTVVLLFLLLISSCSSSKIDSSFKDDLDKLDREIEIRDKYLDQKEIRISNLVEILKDGSLSLEDRYRYSRLLFDEYSTYQSKLMYSCAQDLIDISEKLNNKNRLVESQICLAYSYLWCGAFKEACEFASTIDTTEVKPEVKVNYLMFLLNLNFESGLYVKPLRFFFDDYDNKMLSIVEQLSKLLPPDDDRLIEAKQKECFHSDKFHEAYEYLQQRIENSSGVSREMSAKLGDIGFMCLEMGDTVSAVSYMVQSAIVDIQIGSRQSPALRKIAESIYPHEDLTRAYKYIQLSMENAVFFDSRYRIYESSIALPQIDKDLYNRTKHQKDRLLKSILMIIFSVVSLILALVYIWKINQKLESSALLIQHQNETLLTINDRFKYINKELVENNDIKNVYLGKILSTNSSLICRIEDLVTVIKRKLKTKQYDDITQFIFDNEYLKERKDMLLYFDKMFLHLFPTFIDEFNAFLKDECKIIIDKEDTLSPELRIFALVRLGVTKNETIADILNFSESTVRNYKTKIRNNSILPNDEFDKKIMNIQSKNIF